MNRDETCKEARATAPPTPAGPATIPPPDVRFALRLIMQAGSEGHGGSRGEPGALLRRWTRDR